MGPERPAARPNHRIGKILRIPLRFRIRIASATLWMPHPLWCPQASPRRFCARSGHGRYSVRLLDLHSRTGDRPGHQRGAGDAGQFRRDTSARTNGVDGRPAWTRLPPHGLPPGVDAGGRRRFSGFLELPCRPGARAAARRAAPQPVLLRKPAGGCAARGDGAWRPDYLDSGRARPFTTAHALAEVVSRYSGARDRRSRYPDRAYGLDAFRAACQLHARTARGGDLSGPQSHLFQSLRQQRGYGACGRAPHRRRQAGLSAHAAHASTLSVHCWRGAGVAGSAHSDPRRREG